MEENFTSDLLNVNANEKGSSMDENEVKRLPDVSTIQNYTGKKEGDTKIFKNGDKPMA